MSFIYGGVSTATLEGVTTSLQEHHSLGGLTVETVKAPGVDGEQLAATSRDRTEWQFVVLVEGASPGQALERAAQFAAFIDPERGAQTLNPTGIVEPTAWHYPDAIAAGPIDWARHTWDNGNGYQLRGKLSMTSSPHARPDVDEHWALSSAGTVAVRRTLGGASSYPTLTLRGTLASGDTATITVGDWQLVIQGPLTASQVAKLDYENFDFAIWDGSTKVASLVPRMSQLDRLKLWPGIDYSVDVATTGTLTQLRVDPNTRNH